MIESRHEKTCLCDLRITNALHCQGIMIPTVPISEIPRLLQAYIDMDWFELFSRDADNATLSLMNRRNKTESFFFFFFFLNRFTLYFQRIPFADYFVNS